MQIEYVYEKAECGLVKREARRITCKCGFSWLIRKDRAHSGLCRKCKVTGENNPMFGKTPHNKGIITYNRKEYVKVYYDNIRKENRRKAIWYLGNKCFNCMQENLPICCYDIHHVDPKEKLHNVSQLFAYSWAVVEEELKKCVLLCAHCHRILHNNEERLNDNSI